MSELSDWKQYVLPGELAQARAEGKGEGYTAGYRAGFLAAVQAAAEVLRRAAKTADRVEVINQFGPAESARMVVACEAFEKLILSLTPPEPTGGHDAKS